MSKTPFPTRNSHGLDTDTSAANNETNGRKKPTFSRHQWVLHQLNNTPKFTDEWFRLKDQEMQLRSHADITESSHTAAVVDGNKVGDGDETDDLPVGTSKISTLEGKNHAIQEDDGCPSSERFPLDSSSGLTGAIIEEAVKEDDNINVMAGDLLVPSFSNSTAKESNFLHDNKRKREMTVTHIASLSAQVPTVLDFEADINDVPLGMGSKDNDPSPTPFSLCAPTSVYSEKAKENPTIETHCAINDEGPPSAFTVRVEDAATGKLSRGDAKTAIKSDQSASSAFQSSSKAGPNHMNRDQLLHDDDVVQKPWFSAPPVSQTDSIHPRSSANVVAQARLNENVLNEEEKADVIEIPEAFLVHENAQVELAPVEVAELLEPDQNTLLLKKRHACIVSILFAAVVITLSVTFYIKSLKPPSTAMPEKTVALSPSLHPTLIPLSSQPSFLQSSLSVKDAIEKNVLQRNVTFDGMEDTNARILALDWIDNKDPMGLVASSPNLFQRYVLVLLAYESNRGWLSDVHSTDTECKWLGVECDTDGRIITLELSDSNLEGTMPPEIGSLQFLRTLSMSGNFLDGTLPHELGNLKALTELNLNANNFKGTLPSEIGNMEKLTVLNLATNKFTGTLPLGLWNLNKLISLSLESNRFSGTLLSGFGNLIELNALDLRGNLFSGTLPPQLGNLNKLAELSISSNKFSGSLPSELGNLSNLTALDLSYNSFSGPLPSNLGKINTLTTLNIVDNQFTGSLPSELGNMRKLTYFELYYNKFTGTLPSELGNLQQMTDLMLSVNRFNGTLPTEIGNMKELRFVRFNENFFTGTLPTELGILKMLEQLFLFSNEFSGTIPSDLRQLTSLTHFSIYRNKFRGTLPSWIGQLSYLDQLYAGRNQFTGTLPSELGLLKDLTHLEIEENSFTGTFPSWIGNLRYLTDIRLNNNQFTGTFPSEIGNNLDLSLLWLNDNQFTGTFPSEIDNNLNLMSFCLSSNNFTGNLPAEIQLTVDCQY